MAHQAKSVSTPENRAQYAHYHQTATRWDMADRSPATAAQRREVRRQFEEIFANLTDSEACELLRDFEGIYDWRTPRHLWKRLVFVPHDSDHAEWSPAITVKKGGVR